MTLSMCKRLVAVHIWRVLRFRKLPFLAFVFVAIVCINTFLSTKNHSTYSKEPLNREVIRTRNFKTLVYEPSALLDQELSGQPKLTLSGLLKKGHQTASPEPQVRKELSSGVHEEENSAREVLDAGVGDKDAKHFRVEDNAANEVNSIEHELHINEDKLNGSGLSRDAAGRYHEPLAQQKSHQSQVEKGDSQDFHNWRNLTEKELNNLSVLGRRLYLNENVGTVQNKQFIILVWKSGPSIERRLIRQYGKEKLDPFRKCSVSNCEIRYEDALSSTADAILIHLHRTRGPSFFPRRTNFNQRWIWLTDESPYHTFMVAKDKNLVNYNGYFNWSMSYRMDSDIPVPYGRTIEMTDAEASLYQKVDYFNLKSKTVAVMGSNCGGKNKRWNYVKELQKFMEVDVYGGCGTLKCPGHFNANCKSLDNYKFYLAFENGDCKEYITEKAWWNALGKGAVPVVMGGKIEDYRKILPPDSFIHVDEFQSPHLLAKHLLSVAHDQAKYMHYHAWRSQFRVANEHGYFASDVFHYCRICEALNYNDQAVKVYNNMEIFWNKDTQCYDPSWQTRMMGT